MESNMTNPKDLRYTVVGGERYWHSYEEAKMHPVKCHDGRIFRWVGSRDGTFVELRT